MLAILFHSLQASLSDSRGPASRGLVHIHGRLTSHSMFRFLRIHVHHTPAVISLDWCRCLLCPFGVAATSRIALNGLLLSEVLLLCCAVTQFVSLKRRLKAWVCVATVRSELSGWRSAHLVRTYSWSWIQLRIGLNCSGTLNCCLIVLKWHWRNQGVSSQWGAIPK